MLALKQITALTAKHNIHDSTITDQDKPVSELSEGGTSWNY